MFETTRTTVVATVAAAAIYAFPGSVSCVATSKGPSGGAVLTLGRASTLQWTFEANLPVGATHTCTVDSGATVSPATSTYVSVRGAGATYTVVPTAKQAVEATITLVFGSVSRSYTLTPIAAANVYAMPTGLGLAVKFTGPTTVAADASIAKLAAGATY